MMEAQWRCCLESCRKVGTYRCAACKVVTYCSQACQRLSWPYHKATCSRCSTYFEAKLPAADARYHLFPVGLDIEKFGDCLNFKFHCFESAIPYMHLSTNSNLSFQWPNNGTDIVLRNYGGHSDFQLMTDLGFVEPPFATVDSGFVKGIPVCKLRLDRINAFLEKKENSYSSNLRRKRPKNEQTVAVAYVHPV